MKIMAFDSSAIAASVCILEDGKLLGESYVNNRQTHSQTLLPMAEGLLKTLSVDLSDIDAFAISAGPGSFTGLRIGVATVKGMAYAVDKPCIGVSTLYATALSAAMDNELMDGCTVCCAMDARCGQVYTALFECRDGKVTRICEDMAIKLTELCIMPQMQSGRIIAVGDGAHLVKQAMPTVTLLADRMRYQRAVGVALAAAEDYEKGKTVAASALSPIYLRLPQAQREQEEKKGKIQQ